MRWMLPRDHYYKAQIAGSRTSVLVHTVLTRVQSANPDVSASVAGSERAGKQSEGSRRHLKTCPGLQYASSTR